MMRSMPTYTYVSVLCYNNTLTPLFLVYTSGPWVLDHHSETDTKCTLAGSQKSKSKCL